MWYLASTLARPARPCAGHPRRSASANSASLLQRRRVGGRDKPGHDDRWLYKRQALYFPARINGEPVYLCWRLGEDRIRFYHAQDEGFAGRKPLDPRDSDYRNPIQ